MDQSTQDRNKKHRRFESPQSNVSRKQQFNSRTNEGNNDTAPECNSTVRPQSIGYHKQGKTLITQSMLYTMLEKTNEIIGNNNILDLPEAKQQDLLEYQQEYYKLRDDYVKPQKQLKQFSTDVTISHYLTTN